MSVFKSQKVTGYSASSISNEIGPEHKSADRFGAILERRSEGEGEGIGGGGVGD